MDMDIDEPDPSLPPPEAISTTNTFVSSPLTPPNPQPPTNTSLNFDAANFSAKQAFGLESNDYGVGDMSLDEIPEMKNDQLPKGEGKELVIAGNEASGSTPTETIRRRKVSLKKRKPQMTNAPNEDDDGQLEHDQVGEKTLFGNNALGKREFNFQIHHHHQTSPDYGHGSSPEQWLNRHTPKTLIGLVITPSACYCTNVYSYSYLQFACLTLLLLFITSLLTLFIYTLSTDVKSRIQELSFERRADVLQCAKAYVDNHCEPGKRLPALARKCSEWEECMGRETDVGGKTRVVAETLAEVINGFVEVMSLKTMVSSSISSARKRAHGRS